MQCFLLESNKVLKMATQFNSAGFVMRDTFPVHTCLQLMALYCEFGKIPNLSLKHFYIRFTDT